MIRISGFQNSDVLDEQVSYQSLPLFRPLGSGIGSNGAVALKHPIAQHRNLFSGRFSIKGGFSGSGTQRRMVIVGKIGKF